MHRLVRSFDMSDPSAGKTSVSGSQPDSTSSDCTMLEAMEKLLTTKLAGIDKRLAEIEKTRPSDSGPQIIKLLNVRFNEVTSKLQQSSIPAAATSGFFGKSKLAAVTAPPRASSPQRQLGTQPPAGADPEVKFRLQQLDEKLDKLLKRDESLVLGKFREISDRFAATQKQLKEIDAKVSCVENKVNIQQSDVALVKFRMEKLSNDMGKLVTEQSRRPPPPPVQGGPMKQTSPPPAVIPDEIKELVPKITSLQKNFEVLLTGESEANALIDQVLPTVTKLQKDMEKLVKDYETDMKSLKEEFRHVEKIQERLDSIYDKVSDAKTDGRDAADNTEDILDKLSKIQKTIVSKPTPRARSGSHGSRTSSGTDDESANWDLRDMADHMVKIHKNVEHLQKDVKKEVANLDHHLHKIKKFMESSGDSRSRDSRGGRSSRIMRGGGQTSYYNVRQTGSNSGTLWVYDEQGRRITDSDEDDYRSDRSRSRSRSRTPKKSRKRSPSGEEQESQQLKAIDRHVKDVAEAVEEIQEKMDSWLKYSKKTLVKSDENTENLMDKVKETQSQVEAIAESIIGERKSVFSKLDDVLDTLDETAEAAKEKPVVKKEANTGAERSKEDDKRLIEDINSKLCEFGSLFESLTSDQCKKLDFVAEKIANFSVGDAALCRFDDVIHRIKRVEKNTVALQSGDQQLMAQLKKLDASDRQILAEAEKRVMSMDDLTKTLKELSPQLDDLYIKILPNLEELKAMTWKNSERDNNVHSETATHIQKMRDILQEMKMDGRFKRDVPFNESSCTQMFNALNELKNVVKEKDQSVSKIVGELKGDFSGTRDKLNLLLKTKANEKLLIKAYEKLEELEKNSKEDIKSFSQLNTMIQGLKESISSHENNLCEEMREVKGQVEKSRDQENDGFKHIIEILSDINDSPVMKGDESKLAAAVGRILGCMEKKLIEATAKEQKLAVGEIRKIVVDHHRALGEEIQSMNTQIIEGFGEERSKITDNQLETQEVLKKLGEMEEKLLLPCEKQYIKVTTELGKYNGILAEILNSVEDLKQLTSTVPNAFHDLLPKMDVMTDGVKEIPNEIATWAAAMEENLCINMETKLKEINQDVLQEVFGKFDLMEQRLAVIKKYAKHGPGRSERHSDADSMPDASQVGHASSADMVQAITRECHRIEEAIQEQLQQLLPKEIEYVYPTVKKILNLCQQVYDDQAKGIVVEDQLEALCNTVLQPIQDIQTGQERLLSLEASPGVRLMNADALQRFEEIQLACLTAMTQLKDVTLLKAEKEDKAPPVPRKLLQHLRLIEKAQKDMLERQDLGIEHQKDLNVVYRDLISILGQILEKVEGHEHMSDLSGLCADLSNKLLGLDELQSKFSSETSPSSQQLNELISRCLEYRPLAQVKKMQVEKTPPKRVVRNPSFHNIKLVGVKKTKRDRKKPLKKAAIAAALANSDSSVIIENPQEEEQQKEDTPVAAVEEQPPTPVEAGVEADPVDKKNPGPKRHRPEYFDHGGSQCESDMEMEVVEFEDDLGEPSAALPLNLETFKRRRFQPKVIMHRIAEADIEEQVAAMKRDNTDSEDHEAGESLPTAIIKPTLHQPRKK